MPRCGARGCRTGWEHTSTTDGSRPFTETENNKDAVRAFLAAFASGDGDAMRAVTSPDLVAHGLPPELGSGPEAMLALAGALHAGMPDCRSSIDDLIGEGDRVAVRYSATGTHAGELMGVPPSGRTVMITGIELYRLEGGRVVEYWGQADLSEPLAPVGVGA